MRRKKLTQRKGRRSRTALLRKTEKARRRKEKAMRMDRV